jgi:hypothetical protein
MPVYEIEMPAKIVIKMEGDTPEAAVNNLDGLLEGFYMQIPCFGHEIKFGDYIAEVWAQCKDYKVRREMPEGFDPKAKIDHFAAYMRMIREPITLTEEEVKQLEEEPGALGSPLPLADKDVLINKVKKDG